MMTPKRVQARAETVPGPACAEDRAAARSRHPTAGGFRPDLGRMARRMAAALREEGHPWPETAATVMAERARQRMDRPAFAARLGIDPAVLAAIEEGRPQRVDRA